MAKKQSAATNHRDEPVMWNSEEGVAYRRFQEQCVLMDYWMYLCRKNQTRSNGQWTPMTYKNFAILNGEPSMLVTKLLSLEDLQSLRYATNIELSSLIPKLRIFKAFYSGIKEVDDGEDKESKQKTPEPVEVEMIFDDSYKNIRGSRRYQKSSAGFGTPLEYDHAGNKLDGGTGYLNTNMRSKGEGVGLKSFTYTLKGTNEAEVDTIDAELVLFASSMSELFQNRIHTVPEEIQDKLGSRLIFNHRSKYICFADLLRYQSPEATEYKIKDHRVRVQIGYQVPEDALVKKQNSRTKVFDEKLLELISKLDTTLLLQLKEHTFDIKEDGSIELSIKYTGWIEGTLASHETSLFDYKSSRSKKKTQQTKLESAIKECKEAVQKGKDSYCKDIARKWRYTITGAGGVRMTKLAKDCSDLEDNIKKMEQSATNRASTAISAKHQKLLGALLANSEIHQLAVNARILGIHKGFQKTNYQMARMRETSISPEGHITPRYDFSGGHEHRHDHRYVRGSGLRSTVRNSTRGRGWTGIHPNSPGKKAFADIAPRPDEIVDVGTVTNRGHLQRISKGTLDVFKDIAAKRATSEDFQAEVQKQILGDGSALAATRLDPGTQTDLAGMRTIRNKRYHAWQRSHGRGRKGSKDPNTSSNALKAGGYPFFTVRYFHLGALIDVALDMVRDHIKEEGGDTHDFDNINWVLGPISFRDPYSGRPAYVNLADIPISLNRFLGFFTKRFVVPMKRSYSLKEFLQDVIGELVVDALGPECFGGDPANSIPKVSMTQFVLPAKTYAGGKKKIVVFDKVGEKNKKRYKRYHIKDISERLKKMRKPKAYDRLKDLDQYVLIFVSGLPPRHLKGHIDTDMKNGVFHFSMGADLGLLKKLEFNKKDMKYLAEAQVHGQGGAFGDFISTPYDCNARLYGIPIFKPGMQCFINPTRADTPYASRPNSIGRLLNIGGYYHINKVDNRIEPGEYSTFIECVWTSHAQGFKKVDAFHDRINRGGYLTSGPRNQTGLDTYRGNLADD